MAILEVLKFPDPRLRKVCPPVKEVNAELKKLAKDMLDTMYSFRGIGLAAAQVNQPYRLVVIDTRPTENGRYKMEDLTELEQQVEQPLILFNPEVIEYEGKTSYDEGCLSVPGYYETVQRHEKIKVKALNLDGEQIEFVTDGLLSICIQHEIDHLDGKVFIDRLSTIKANRLKSKIKKHGYPDMSSDSEEELDEIEAVTEESELKL